MNKKYPNLNDHTKTKHEVKMDRLVRRGLFATENKSMALIPNCPAKSKNFSDRYGRPESITYFLLTFLGNLQIWFTYRERKTERNEQIQE